MDANTIQLKDIQRIIRYTKEIRDTVKEIFDKLEDHEERLVEIVQCLQASDDSESDVSSDSGSVDTDPNKST